GLYSRKTPQSVDADLWLPNDAAGRPRLAPGSLMGFLYCAFLLRYFAAVFTTSLAGAAALLAGLPRYGWSFNMG
ncbi:MAG: hypothetical protein ACK55Z_21450, partial [bacterium]